MERNNLALALRAALREPVKGESAEEVLLEALTSMLNFIEKNHRWAVLFFRELLTDRDGSDALHGRGAGRSTEGQNSLCFKLNQPDAARRSRLMGLDPHAPRSRFF
jgi:hypothetical protein